MTRRGTTLAEMSVALLLVGCAAAIGASLLVAAERRTRAATSGDLADQTTAAIATALGGDVAGADPDSVFVRGDTALEIAASVGVSVVCAINGGELILPPASATTGRPFSAWRQPPERDDVALAWDSAARAWRALAVDRVAWTQAGGGCAAGSTWRSVADSVARFPVLRLGVRGPIPALLPGTPVRVLRRVRWVAYRAPDGRWWLGLRRCAAASCGAVQPAAGPLAPPADSGFIVRATAHGVEVTARPAGGGVARMTIAVRGRAP